MCPILLAIGPFTLYGYGAAITLGGLVSGGLLYLRRGKIGFPREEDFLALVNCCVLSGFIGGKLLFMIQYGWKAGLSIMNGYSAFGGFVSVPLCVALFARWKKIPFLKLADYMFLGACMGHIFGRIGCFLAGCCYGRATSRPWGVTFTDPRSMVPPELLGVRLHPVQLYEAAGDLLIALFLWKLLLETEKGRFKPGLVAASYFIAYAALRSSLELLRDDTLPFLGPVTQGQALGLALVAASGAMLAWRRRCIPSC